MGVAEIQHQIESSLETGDSYEQIESFLQNSEMIYDFDRHLQRFQARLEQPEDPKDDNIAIYVYIDDERNFSKAEVKRVYTHL